MAHASDQLMAAADLAALARNTIDAAVELIGSACTSFMIFNLVTHDLVLEECSCPHRERFDPPRIEVTDQPTQVVYNQGDILLLQQEGTQKFLIIFDRNGGDAHRWELRVLCPVCNDYIGILSIGQKVSGMDYSKEEVDALRVLVNVLSLCCLKLQGTLVADSGDNGAGRKAKAPVAQPRIHYRHYTTWPELLGQSEEILHIKELIERVAGEDVPVLITGESGTGKELVARAIHQKSRRSERPLVAMNCAALPEALVESELFGYEKGAFTGAVTQKKGKFEFADGSTLFLDEIGDMSLLTQAKLLRVLQDGSFQRVGGHRTLYTDVRLVAATNKDLPRCIENGSFREDLYYRLNVVQIHIPPLRQRKQDIRFLAEHFFRFYNDFYQKGLEGLDDEAMQWLLDYSFPGNVRELMNIIERSVIMERSRKVTIHFMPTARDQVSSQNIPAGNEPLTLEALEKQHILFVMKRMNNNKSAAARALGIARKTLREKLTKYNLEM